MVLFIILSLTLLILTVTVILLVSAGGAIFIVIFGDVIVCIFIIAWIIKHLIKK